MQSVASLHLFSTLAMVGLIWFVQIVHYPMMADVGVAEFKEYERIHQQRTTLVVAPLMLTEFASSLLLWFYSPDPLPRSYFLVGGLLLALIWGSTFFLQVPTHTRLSVGFNASDHRFLVLSNWIRTIAWTARGILSILIVKIAFRA